MEGRRREGYWQARCHRRGLRVQGTLAELILGWWLRIVTGWLRPTTGGQTLHHDQIGSGGLVIHTGP